MALTRPTVALLMSLIVGCGDNVGGSPTPRDEAPGFFPYPGSPVDADDAVEQPDDPVDEPDGEPEPVVPDEDIPSEEPTPEEPTPEEPTPEEPTPEEPTPVGPTPAEPTAFPAETAITLTPTRFKADATTRRGVSAWATAAYPGALPDNARSVIFWGRFQQDRCAAAGSGATVLHPQTIANVGVARAASPDCAGAWGPSVEADIVTTDGPQHLLRTEVRTNGAFQDFGAAGQNGGGANANIQAAYVEFNPSWTSNMANRMHPWGGPSTDPSQIRFALRTRQSVTRDLLEQPGSQQLQQVLRMLVINEACNPAASTSFCQIEFNFKTYNRGFGAYTTFTDGDVFNDAAQGGLIAVVGPVGGVGQGTRINGASAWTSWGASTQVTPFDDKSFQIEMSWNQFQQLLGGVTAGNPASVFGARWNDRTAWTLLRIGYGQENYNRSTTAGSFVEGLFADVELLGL